VPAAEVTSIRPIREPARRAARAVACFDLAATGLLAVPGVELRFFDLLFAIDAMLGWATPRESLGPLALFLANLAGALGVLWALVRIAWPQRRLVASDAAARCGVGALITYAVLARGATPVLFAFVATELVGAAIEAWAAPRLKERRD
jgi:hypothetical protein